MLAAAFAPSAAPGKRCLTAAGLLPPPPIEPCDERSDFAAMSAAPPRASLHTQAYSDQATML